MSLILSPDPPQAGPLLEAGDSGHLFLLFSELRPAEGSRLLSLSLPLETPAIDSNFYAGFSLSCV